MFIGLGIRVESHGLSDLEKERRPQNIFYFNLRQMGWIAVVIISLSVERNSYKQIYSQPSIDL